MACPVEAGGARHVCCSAPTVAGGGSTFRAHLPEHLSPPSSTLLGCRGVGPSCLASRRRQRSGCGMFDRGKGDRAEGPVAVEISLQDGQKLQGKLVVPPGRTLTEVLNGASAFVEFQPVDGERMFIAKSALQCVRPMNVPPVPNSGAGQRRRGRRSIPPPSSASPRRQPGGGARGLSAAGQDLSSRPICRRGAAAGGARVPGGHGTPRQRRLRRAARGRIRGGRPASEPIFTKAGHGQ